MKIRDLRQYAYSLVRLPPDYDGPAMSPWMLDPNPHPEHERRYFEMLGKAAFHYINQRKTK